MKEEYFWRTALDVSERAISTDALIPLTTKRIHSESNLTKGFELRRLISKFPKQLKQKDKTINPFAPYDKRLFIAKINDNHNLILNKFPTQKAHMLLITNNWEPQDGWLSRNDFKALIEIECDTTGLWFFNSSKSAGASQHHRHIQLLPRSENEQICPRDTWFKNLKENNNINRRLSRNISVFERINEKKKDSNYLYNLYINLASSKGLGTPSINEKPLFDYNLLITKDWIALILRSKEGYMGFEINALGFAGYFLSTNDQATNNFLSNGGEKILMGVVR